MKKIFCKHPALYLYILGFIVAAAAILFLRTPLSTANLDVDELFYFTIAKRLAAGDFFVDIYRPMGFSTSLAIIYLIAGKNLWITQILLTMLATTRVPLTYFLAKKIVRKDSVATISALITAMWPISLFYSASLYSETITVPLFLLMLTTLPRKREGNWLLPGALLGILILFHPMYTLFIPFAFLIIWMEQGSFKIAVKPIALCFLGCAFIILPWSVIASKKASSFVMISVNQVDALAGSLNPVLIQRGYQHQNLKSGKSVWVGPGKWTHEHGYLEKEEENLPQIEKNALVQKRLLEWVQNNPKDALYLQTAKLAYLWGIYPLFVGGYKHFIFGNIPILLLLALSLMACYRFRNEILTLSRLWMPLFFICLVSQISWGSWRYRQSVDICLIILSTLYLFSSKPTIREKA